MFISFLIFITISVIAALITWFIQRENPNRERFSPFEYLAGYTVILVIGFMYWIATFAAGTVITWLKSIF